MKVVLFQNLEREKTNIEEQLFLLFLQIFFIEN